MSLICEMNDDCLLPANCFDVRQGRRVCSVHVTGGIYFKVEPLKGGGYGVFRVRQLDDKLINLFEEDFVSLRNAMVYGFCRMLEEREQIKSDEFYV